MTRSADGSAGDVDYGVRGATYSRYRRADPRIAAMIHRALGDARSVVNVGAGAGSYEPSDREVIAIEPSASMRAQRPAELPEAIDALAEQLPLPDASVDAAMATFTVHQWSDLAAGLAQMRRVARGPVVVLTCDPLEVERFWLADYAPEVLAAEARRYPSLEAIAHALGGSCEIASIAIPLDCTDGFNEAYYGRPEQLLDGAARLACSAWSFVGPAIEARFVTDLTRDLADGTWDDRYAALRRQPDYVGSLRLIVNRRS